ncbi:MAG: MBL fold metallo-hydrolase, partial [Desulfobacterales bacterium]|nr:MBL fold metallo-hydrolase [Desulfobacterales bacterium]
MTPSETGIEMLSDRLGLITLTPPIPGFDDFIAAWLYKGEDATFVVDVGPSATADGLLNALDELGVKRLDYILLTHIHLDHAGAAGEMTRRFPDARIVCHKAGIPHLADPSRLWKGTVKTLGKTGEAYGPIQPVPRERLVDAEAFVSDAVHPIITPGHSPHHVSFRVDGCLFAGEAGGVHLASPDRGAYLRPATPPRFFLDVAIQSIDALMDGNPGLMCYGHFGAVPNGAEMLAEHRRQLRRWERLIEDEMNRGRGADDLVDACLAKLLAEDPLLEGFSHLPGDAREREKGFMINSVKGFIGYIEGKG